MNNRNFLLAVAGCALALFVLLPDMAGAADQKICGFEGGDLARGDKIYHETCVACHGEDGRGTVPGASDFTKKGGVLKKPHSVLEEHIKNGFQEQGKPIAMPPQGGNPDLNHQDMHDVHAYLHKKFGCG